MGKISRETFINQYFKRLKNLLERYLPENDEESEMIKIANLIESGETRHIDETIKNIINK
ncbi:MAG: hypothetical protein KAQ99_08700 [Candidatus Aureabacteria bacterium]|nr:hypothetical protein [Candidatus Auribacterota bacterium]